MKIHRNFVLALAVTLAAPLAASAQDFDAGTECNGAPELHQCCTTSHAH